MQHVHMNAQTEDIRCTQMKLLPFVPVSTIVLLITFRTDNSQIVRSRVRVCHARKCVQGVLQFSKKGLRVSVSNPFRST
eukprot:4084340-Prymnesium_polylepis.2